MYRLVFLICAAGCAGSPLSVMTMSEQELQTLPMPTLCNAFNFSPGDRILAELVRRNVFTEQEWDAIGARQVFVGMKETAMICAWGLPTVDGAINRTVTARGASSQYVYRGTFGGTRYVYVEGGRIVAWQD